MNKPKIFIVAACRGELGNIPVSFVRDGPKDGLNRKTVPQLGDYAFCYSCLPDMYSLRSPQTGTFFIKTLCETIRQRQKKSHFMDILQYVNRHFLEAVAGVQGNADFQTPIQETTLTRNFWL